MSEPNPALKENERTQWAGNLKIGKQWDFFLAPHPNKTNFESMEGKKSKWINGQRLQGTRCVHLLHVFQSFQNR